MMSQLDSHGLWNFKRWSQGVGGGHDVVSKMASLWVEGGFPDKLGSRDPCGDSAGLAEATKE